MDATIIIATVIVLLIVIFITSMKYLMTISNKKELQSITSKLEEYEQDTQISIFEKNIIAKSAIALDSQNKKILYVTNDYDGEYVTHVISIQNIEKVTLWYESLTKGYVKQEVKNWDLQQISLRIKTVHGKIYSIVFYDGIRDGPDRKTAYNELAKNWTHKIQSYMSVSYTH